MDLKSDFPESKGFSVRNLKYMKKLAEEYQDLEFVQTVSAQLTWHHNTTLLEKVADKNTRAFYARNALENGWSCPMMVTQIETALHSRWREIESCYFLHFSGLITNNLSQVKT